MIDRDVQTARLLELLERYGRNLHSFMVLEPGLSVWSGDDAAVAYTQRGGYWVAVGGPLCAPEHTLSVANAFRESASKEGFKVVFFGVTQSLVDRLRNSTFDSLQVGLVAVWNPGQWLEVVRGAEKLRNRLSKAKRGGITVGLLRSDEVAEGSSVRKQLVDIVDDWSDRKSLPPMGFMVTVELFQHSDRRRYFVVESEGTIHGFAVCVPIYGRNGWLLEDMMIRPESPAGCSEALVDGVMRQLSAEGAEIVSLGMVALAGLDAGVETERHPMLSGLLRFCARTMGWLYHFEGLYRFRNKMKPLAWEKVYVVSSGPVTFWTIRAILMAFAEGWVPRFAVRVLGRWARRWFRRRDLINAIVRNQRPYVDVTIVSLAVVCLSVAFIAITGSYQDWLPWWGAVGLGFVACFAGFTPVHEAVHGNVSRWRVLNNLVGHVCSLLLNGAFRPYCFLHREHHVHTNQATEDPDLWCGNGPRWLIPLRWFTQDIGYLLHYFSKWPTRPIYERAELLLCGCVYLGLAVGTFLVNRQLCVALILGWFLPARLALFALAATFSWLPHQPHLAKSPYLATTVHSSPWLTWLLFGQNFHLVHHLDPSVPFYELENKWKNNRMDYLQRGAVDRSCKQETIRRLF